jgi:phosphoribosyl 1,2-cyclic phosphodiesterase
MNEETTMTNTANYPFTVKFWGVRGSYPAPGHPTAGYGGNTACVEVRAGEHTIILDAGTGLIGLGRDLARRPRLGTAAPTYTLLLSHLHHDHTQGFPFFAPAYQPGVRLFVFGPEAFEQALEEVFSRNQNPPVFPVRLGEMGAAKHFHSLQEGEQIAVGGAGGVRVQSGPDALAGGEAVSIRCMRSHAHPGRVLIYRLEYRSRVLVYATDTEGYVGGDQRLAAFARGADLLIHDAQYTQEHYRGLKPGLPATQGYGHSTAEMACELAAAAGVEQLALFHHDPGYDDDTITAIEARARQLFPHVLAAREGLELNPGRDTHPPASLSAPAAHSGAAASQRPPAAVHGG